jgi:hypothetical protein
MSNIVLIGSDPELFVGKDNTVLTAIGLIGGTKSEPLPVKFGALQEDNVLLEYNIDPADSLEGFAHNIKAVLEQGREALAKHGLDVIRGISSYTYPEDVLYSAGEQAFVFGCDPDKNAWTNEYNVFPYDVDPLFRTAGGHLHIGYSHLGDVKRVTNRGIVKMCDFLLGIPSVILDKDEDRRKLYGGSGSMRDKPYGVEYRTLSNFWLFSDELIQWAYQGAVDAYSRLGELEGFLDLIPGEEVQRIINEGDKLSAAQACKTLGIAV